MKDYMRDFLFEVEMVLTLMISLTLWGFLSGCEWAGAMILQYFDNLKYKGDTND